MKVNITLFLLLILLVLYLLVIKTVLRLFSHHISLLPATCITIHWLNQQINFYSVHSFIFRQYVVRSFIISLDGQATYDAYFGQGTGAVALEQVACTGSETSLLSCQSNIIFQTDCSHSDDAGVICQGNFAI